MRKFAADSKRCPRCETWKPVGEFAYRQGKRGLSPDGYCKPCKSEYSAAHRRTAEQERTTKLMTNFGLTPERYAEMLDKQQGVCALCGRPETDIGRSGNVKFLSVDHDRSCCPGTKSCGKCIRGILCSKCNTGLGKFNDDPELMAKAIAYLTKGTGMLNRNFTK